MYGVALLAGVAGAAGDIVIYHWAKHGGFGWIIVSCAVFSISVMAFGLLLRFDGRSLGTAFLFVTMLHSLTIVACDRFYFGKRFNPMEWAGFAFAVVAVVLLELGHADEQSSETDVGAKPSSATTEKRP